MAKLEKKWEISPKISPEADQNLAVYPPTVRQILFNRGIGTQEAAETYFSASYGLDSSPMSILGIEDAVERINFAIQRQEPIAVYGDYDVDGVTATVLLVLFLRSRGANVTHYIPDRFEEGYGLNTEAIKTLINAGIRLVITVDCGIRSVNEVAYARQHGLDMIISDHHHPGSELPPALAIINPKQIEDSYPEKNLAGVGLAYKLAQALTANTHDKEGAAVEAYLDLVALGTVADLAPLVGENRTLVRRGLDEIHRAQRQGVVSLIHVAGLDPQKIKASHIGFTLGPRLNAAGRLESAIDALKLLMTTDPRRAGELAQKLNVQNQRRQIITREIEQKAEKLAFQHNPDAMVLFAAHPEFNQGVVGLAASRLVDQYYRPAIVAHQGEEYTRASCRSIPEFHITEALDLCTDLLERHGGHAAAAGFTIRNQYVPELVVRLEEIAHKQLAEKDLRPKLTADLEIPLSQLTPDLLPYLEKLQPTGYGNRQAYFVSRNLQVKRHRTVGKDDAHLRLTVIDGRIAYDAIAFRQGDWAGKLPAKIDLFYTFEVNEYYGRKNLQLNVRDIKPSDQE